MDLMQLASSLFLQKISPEGDAPSESLVKSALQQLLPTSGGELDVSALISRFMGEGGGLSNLVSSWLGDGANDSFSPEKLLGLLGQANVSEFAGKLGIDTGTAASGLSGMIPELIDKLSSGGALKSDLAGSLVSGLAGKFFK